ncbi:MAG TPA: STAS domain-containing protein [Gemmatimonadaceae bacterium]|nr:STAS domain-containing protein [Gemmatimonadaceae bacterium]
MPIHVTAAGPGQPVTLAVSGRFDFATSGEFRTAYAAQPAGTPFVVDLARTEYLDSSALGMLLLLRRHAGDRPESVRIVNASPDVRRILEIAKVERLCRID